jgi:uridine kinase
MSIRTFLDHGVREDHIIVVVFGVTRGRGIAVLRNAFPDVKIVCGTVNNDTKEAWLDVVECKLFFLLALSGK